MPRTAIYDDKTLRVRITKPQTVALERVAKTTGLSLSEIFRQALSEYLDRKLTHSVTPQNTRPMSQAEHDAAMDAAFGAGGSGLSAEDYDAPPDRNPPDEDDEAASQRDAASRERQDEDNEDSKRAANVRLQPNPAPPTFDLDALVNGLK
jgi:Ribbon-helix-helix protein, copG family